MSLLYRSCTDVFMETAGFFIQSIHTQNLKENMRRCELTTRGLIFQASISKIEIFAQSRFHFGDSSLQVKSLALIFLATRSCGFAIGERDLFLSHFP